MIARHLLLGIALAALVAPAVARDAREESKADRDSGFVFDTDAAAPAGRRARTSRRAAAETAFDPNADGVTVTTDGSEALESVRRTRRAAATHPAAKAAVILPPARPVDEAVPDVVATAVAVPGPVSANTGMMAAERVAEPVANQAAVVVLPPMRPSLPEIAAADVSLPDQDEAAERTIGRRVRVGAYPPARPAFASDDAPVEAAAAFTPVSVEGSGTISVVRVLPPERPAFPWDDPVQTASIPDAAPAQPARSLFGALFASVPTLPTLPSLPGLSSLPGLPGSGSGHNGIDGMIARHAKLNDVPEALVHRVVIRESKYNPRAIGHGGALGLMQIKHATARSLGYDGAPMGLLDAETNLTYAVKYLAGAYRTAGGDYDQAVRYYARGYYYAAKAANRRGVAFAAYRGGRRHRAVQEADATVGQDAAAVVASAPVERTATIK